MIKHFVNSGILGAFALVSSAALVACGDDSSSSGVFSMESSFEMVLSKAKYSYNKKDSTLKQVYPVCKEGTLGNLVGPMDADEWDTVTYKAYENKGVITLRKGAEEIKYSLDDGAFPRGFWADPDYDSKPIQNGLRFEKKDLFKKVIRYDGNCLMKDYYSLFRNGVPALENMDATLAAFYERFQADGAKVEEKQMLSDIRALNCSELSMYDGLVKLKAENFKSSSGTIKVTYAKRTCNVSFQLRYAYEQKDCEAAYEEYKNDTKAAPKFNFDDYYFDVTYTGKDDEYCLDYLILDLKKDKGIPTTKSIKSADFARGVVKLVVDGLK